MTRRRHCIVVDIVVVVVVVVVVAVVVIVIVVVVVVVIVIVVVVVVVGRRCWSSSLVCRHTLCSDKQLNHLFTPRLLYLLRHCSCPLTNRTVPPDHSTVYYHIFPFRKKSDVRRQSNVAAVVSC